MPVDKINEDRLYHVLDKFLPSKDKLEKYQGVLRYIVR